MGTAGQKLVIATPGPSLRRLAGCISGSPQQGPSLLTSQNLSQFKQAKWAGPMVGSLLGLNRPSRSPSFMTPLLSILVDVTSETADLTSRQFPHRVYHFHRWNECQEVAFPQVDLSFVTLH